MRKALLFVVMVCCFGVMACTPKEAVTEEYTEEVFESSTGTETVIASDEESIPDENMADENTDENVAEESESDSDVNYEVSEEDDLNNADEKDDTVSIDEQKRISEKDALDIAYDFYYGDSDVKEYSVYCEELPYLLEEDAPYLQKLLGRTYAGVATTGYVVYQFADKTAMEREKYDPANPSPEKDKWILYSLGSTENRAYYVFWLYQYVSDGDGEYHLTTGDYCIVSYDGSVVVSERNDSMGNYMDDPGEWNDLEEY